MRVIGTAGHVDHGKSTLVQALTGIHPDRLKEEREREMTIDLGFAWMNLAIGEGQEIEEIGIVDVPGHRDFIENMLAGIGGIDAVLFVVAADESVMPQTREHLAILNILQIQGGVVVLSKIDMIDDQEWIDLVEADLQEVLVGTILEDAPIIRVSAITGDGLQELKTALGNCLADRPPRPDLNRPRLPVDRVFTIAGFGTVVTGTLSDGQLKIGEEVEILPKGVKGRVRGLQTHKKKEQTAVPGSRTAVNISGVSLDEITRGNVVAHPGAYLPTQRLDARFHLLDDVSAPIKHNMEVKLFIGATETLARLRLLGSEELIPGQEGWLQLEPIQPIVAARGDRYILRRPSPGETLGGGAIVDPHPKWRHKRFAKTVLGKLEALAKGTPADILRQAMISIGAAPYGQVAERSNLDASDAQIALEELWQAGELINLDHHDTPKPADLVISKGLWEQISTRTIQELEEYHQKHPLRPGLPREELKSRLKSITRASPKLFNAVQRKLVEDQEIYETGPLVRLPHHEIRFTPEQQVQVRKLLDRFALEPYSPPTVKDCTEQVGEEILQALIELGELTAAAPDVVFRTHDFDQMVADTKELIHHNGGITVAQARDHFKTSRRYILAFLEHLDTMGVTVRAGDIRKLKD